MAPPAAAARGLRRLRPADRLAEASADNQAVCLEQNTRVALEKSGTALVFISGLSTCAQRTNVPGKHPQARAADALRAGEFLLAIAGVRASDVASQEPCKEIISMRVFIILARGPIYGVDYTATVTQGRQKDMC